MLSGTSGRRREGLTYTNKFTCIPAALPYRPRASDAAADVKGTQTAVVVARRGMRFSRTSMVG